MAVKRFIKVVSKLFLIGLVSLFISGAGLFSSKSEELATDQNVKNKKPFAKIEEEYEKISNHMNSMPDISQS